MPTFRGRRPRVAVQLALLIGLPFAPAAAQSPADTAAPGGTARVAPGPQYDAGWLHRLFFGRHYRDLWSTPIEAPELDLGSFAGGLKVTRRGGGEQTKSIRLEGADGKEYQFRSIDKDPVLTLPPALRTTAAAGVVRDQTSAGHPVGALLAPPILEAAGVLHSAPQVVILPKDDPRLGEFAAEFGGMLGTIEERPRDDEDASFAGASEVISTAKLLKEVEDSPGDQVDARAFLTARLVDVFIGDWDRHADQWRWARFGDTRPRLWRPIPRDRDQAFARYDGLLLTVARASTPQLVNFGPSYSGMLGQTWNGRDLDRRFLVPLERAVWDSVATALQSRLTDEVIESAAARLPPSYVPLDSARLANALKRRRDDLPEAAGRYYRHLAGEVEVHGTDRDEIAQVHRVDGRVTEVSLALPAEDGQAADPYFRRRFDSEETKEVRLMLHDGADRVRVWGAGDGGIRIRVLPGQGHRSDQRFVARRARHHVHRGGGRRGIARPRRSSGSGPIRSPGHGDSRLGRSLALGDLARRRTGHRRLRRHRCFTDPLRVSSRSRSPSATGFARGGPPARTRDGPTSTPPGFRPIRGSVPTCSPGRRG